MTYKDIMLSVVLGFFSMFFALFDGVLLFNVKKYTPIELFLLHNYFTNYIYRYKSRTCNIYYAIYKYKIFQIAIQALK